MDWIERWFGLNPDGGDGSSETLLLVALVVVSVPVVVRLNSKLRRRVASLLGPRARKQVESNRGE
jgi:hypothetical protein